MLLINSPYVHQLYNTTVKIKMLKINLSFKRSPGYMGVISRNYIITNNIYVEYRNLNCKNLWSPNFFDS